MSNPFAEPGATELKEQLKGAVDGMERYQRANLEARSENEQLRARLAAAEERLALMACGHPMCVVWTGGEGTSFCEMCRLEADNKHFRKALRELEDTEAYAIGVIDAVDSTDPDAPKRLERALDRLRRAVMVEE